MSLRQLACDRALVAKLAGDALFVDMGSTTTDIIPIEDGAVANEGYTDAERLLTGELVYTGFTRTFLFGVASVGAGPRQADAADERIFRLDGRRASHPRRARRSRRQASDGRRQGEDRRRLDRAAGAHGRPRRRRPDAAEWRDLAAWFSEQQLAHDPRRGVPALPARSPPDAPIVAAGTGRWQIKRLAERMERRLVDLADIIPADDAVRSEASIAAPASRWRCCAG